MDESQLQLIRQEYEKKRTDFSDLFETILSVADQVGLDEALRHLERCVVERRLSWLSENIASLERTADPVADAYSWFYEVYLGISTPEDGEVVERSDRRLVTRWWNHCPVLEACRELGLDTRQICKRAYHQPAQAFLLHIDPRLVFDRNYECIRPYAPYCEEIITLEE